MIKKIYAIWTYVNDIRVSRDFYENVLGLQFKLQDGHWIEFDLDGTSFAILQREPSQGPLKPQKMRTMFQVDDIEQMKRKLLENNIKLIGDIRKEKYGKLLTFEDPNGHWLELFEPVRDSMKILIFTEGTLLMHKDAVGNTREQIVQQVTNEEKSVFDYKSYVPIGDAVNKLRHWKKQGAKIVYLTSRRKQKEVKQIQDVLKKYQFPDGPLLSRKRGETYAAVAERVLPDILIEDDCESIGGAAEMTITHVKQKKDIKSILVKEFGGIDRLPNCISQL